MAIVLIVMYNVEPVKEQEIIVSHVPIKKIENLNIHANAKWDIFN